MSTFKGMSAVELGEWARKAWNAETAKHTGYSSALLDICDDALSKFEQHVVSPDHRVTYFANDNVLRIDFVVPGYEKSDFTIDVHNSELKVSAVDSTLLYGHSDTRLTEHLVDTFTGRLAKAFTHTFNFQYKIDENEVSAVYENGILKIIAGCRADVKARTVTVS